MTETENISGIELLLCSGPRCEAAGGGDLLRAVRRLPQVMDGRVQLNSRYCCARCEQSLALLPAAKIDGKWLPDATPARLVAAIRQAVAETSHAR